MTTVKIIILYLREEVNLADITTDLFELKYSQIFSMSGMEEADITLKLDPPFHRFYYRIWYRNRWCKSHFQCNSKAV